MLSPQEIQRRKSISLMTSSPALGPGLSGPPADGNSHPESWGTFPHGCCPTGWELSPPEFICQPFPASAGEGEAAGVGLRTVTMKAEAGAGDRLCRGPQWHGSTWESFSSFAPQRSGGVRAFMFVPKSRGRLSRVLLFLILSFGARRLRWVSWHLAAGRGGCAPAPARPRISSAPAPQTAGLTRLRAHPVPRPSSSRARSPGLEGPRDVLPRGSRLRAAASCPGMGIPPAGHSTRPVSAAVPAPGALGAASPTPPCPQATSSCVHCPGTCVVLARDARAPRLWMSCLLVLLHRVGVVRTSSSFPGRTTV